MPLNPLAGCDPYRCFSRASRDVGVWAPTRAWYQLCRRGGGWESPGAVSQGTPGAWRGVLPVERTLERVSLVHRTG